MTRLVLIVLAALALPAQAGAAPHPADCEPGTVLMGSQVWYPDGDQHMHMDICAPVYQTVSGVISMKGWRTKHNVQGTSDIMYRRGRNDNGIFDTPAFSHPNFWTPATGTFQQAFTITYDTTRNPYNGLFDMVIQQKNKDTPCASDRLAILDIPVRAANGKPLNDYDETSPGAAGFCDAFYATIELFSTVPTTPVAEPFLVDAKFADAVCSSKANCHLSGPVTSYSVHLDPAFHGGHEGTVLAAGEGSNPRVQWWVDPAVIPGTGWHNLVMKANQPVVSRGTLNSGLLNFWFYDAVDETLPPEPEPEPEPDTVPPDPPTDFREEATGDTQTAIPFLWTASPSSDVSHYEIRRAGDAWLNVSNVTSYTYEGLTCGGGWDFELAAVDAAGNRSDPASARGTTDLC